MRIKTITCHDVYNVGASLQAFALQKYLSNLGHDVEIIDYKPDYLSKHYSLTTVNNPKYDKPILREIYILLKLRRRIRALKSEKKRVFDAFTKQNLRLTEKKYHSIQDLRTECPEADLYFAGSDQIWNPLFPNGKDPSFFLDFVPKGKIKASYAASFAVDEISEEDRERDQAFLCTFNHISVREGSALEIIKSMGLSGIHVCDPVFLLDPVEWKKIMVPFKHDGNYIFVYDFDYNQTVHHNIRDYAKEHNLEIVSAFPFEGGKQLGNLGPLEFLGVVDDAELVISNSFHATAFSIVFHTPFLVFDRQEKINTRMKDLVRHFGVVESSLINSDNEIPLVKYDWSSIDSQVHQFVKKSKEYLDECIEGR